MANEVVIKVRVDDQSRQGFAAALAESRVFGDMMEHELKAAGMDAGSTAGEEVASELNKQLRALRLPELDVHMNADEAREKIKELEVQVRALASDNPTIDVKIRSDKALSELAAFKRRFKEVEDDGDKNGQGWASKFIGAAKGKLMGLGGEGLSSVLTTAGIALAPMIGASIAGAVVGGAGIGGIAGGMALAARDERVQFAMLNLQDSLTEKLTNAVEPFVPVAVQSINQVNEHLNRLNFGKMFADLAPQVAPLINGVTDFIDKMGAALEKVFQKSGPVIQAIGQEIGDLGTVIGRGLGSLADNSDKEALALKDLFAVINGSIDIAFKFLNTMAQIYDVFHKMEQISLPGVFELLSDKSRKVKDSAVEMAEAVMKTTIATDDQTTSVELATNALHQEDDAIHQVSKSLKASTDPLFAFMDAQDSLTEKQKAMNTAISQHGKNSQQARQATKDYQRALIDYVSAAAGATNGTGHLTAEQKRLLSSAGASKQRINELDNALYQAWKQANKLDGFEVDVTVATHFKEFGKPYSDMTPYQFHGLAHGGIKGAASGPISSGLTWVGENGPELMDLPPGTSVRTSGDSARMMRQMAGAGAGMTGPIIINLELDGHQLATATVDPMRNFVRNRFGGNVQLAYGQG